MKTASVVAACAGPIALAVLAACRDLNSFSTANGDRYEGRVTDGAFVLSGVDAGTTLCLTIDTNHLQDAPGALSTSDGRFQFAPLRPIPQIWNDPLSTFTFGEGRVANFIYVVRASMPFADGDGNDVFATVSLMQTGGVEVRLLRGAPIETADGGAAANSNVFAVFTLAREAGPCSY